MSEIPIEYMFLLVVAAFLLGILSGIDLGARRERYRTALDYAYFMRKQEEKECPKPTG
jgi:hypothetical protein